MMTVKYLRSVLMNNIGRCNNIVWDLQNKTEFNKDEPNVLGVIAVVEQILVSLTALLVDCDNDSDLAPPKPDFYMSSGPLPTEQWTPKMHGRALYFIAVLANTPPDGWLSKKEIHSSLAEFRFPQDSMTSPISSRDRGGDK
jgi:hypothetical protein